MLSFFKVAGLLQYLPSFSHLQEGTTQI
jgi:hypothetical protein